MIFRISSLSDGKNDGSVNGESYFSCTMKHGVFVKTIAVVMWDVRLQLSALRCKPLFSISHSSTQSYMAEKNKKASPTSPAPAPAAAPTVAPTAASKKLAAPSAAAAKSTTAKTTAAKTTSAKMTAATSPKVAAVAPATAAAPATPEPAHAPAKTSPSTPPPSASTSSTPATPVTPPAPDSIVSSSSTSDAKSSEAIAKLEEKNAELNTRIEEITANAAQKEKELTTALEKFTVHLQSLTAKTKELEASKEEERQKAEDLTSLMEEATLQEEVLKEELEAARKLADETKESLEKQLQDKETEIASLKAAVASAGDSSDAAASLAEAAGKLASARHELESLKSSHHKELSDLQSKSQTLQAELEEAKQIAAASISAASEDSTASAAEISSLNEKLSSLEASLSSATSDIDSKDKLLGALKRELAEAQLAISASNSSSADSTRAIVAEMSLLKAELADTQGKLANESAATLAATERAVNAESQLSSAASAQRADSDTEIALLKSAVASLEKDKTSQADEIASLKQQVVASADASASSAAAAHSIEVNSLREQVSVSAASLEASVATLAEVQGKLVATEDNLASLAAASTSTISELKSQIAAAEKKAAEQAQLHADAVTSQEHRVAELAKELKAATSGAGDVEAQLRADLAEKRERVSNLEEELSHVNIELQTLHDESVSAKSELVIQRELMEDVEAKLNDAQTRLSEAETSHEEELNKIEKQLSGVKAANAELEARLEETRRIAATATSPTLVAAPAPAVDESAFRIELDKVKASFEDQIASLSDQLEMAAVDKELAEGQAEQYQHEVAALNQQLGTLQAALAEAKTQQSIGDAHASVPTPLLPADDGESGASSASAQQIAQLTEALLKLREFAETNQRELVHLQSEVVPNLELAKTALEEKVLDYEDRFEALKASVEDAQGLQDRFQELFDQKMDLEEDNKSLREAMSDLQTLRDLADETEENHQALEKRLQADLYSKQVEVLDKDGVVANKNLVIEEQAVTIERLERYLNEVQKIHALQAQNAALQAESSSTLQQEPSSKESEELASLLRQQASRESAKAVQDALHDLDMQQAILQNRLFRLFVPESAIKSDQEAASLLLLSKRIAYKSTLASLHLRKQFAMDRFDRNIDQIDEFNRFVLSLEQMLSRFEFNSSQIVDALQDCDEDAYSKLSKLLYEISPYEKKIDNVLALLKNEDLKINNPPLDDLSITLERFDFLCEKFVPRGIVKPARTVVNAIRSLMFNSRATIYSVRDSIGPATAASVFGLSDDRFKTVQELGRKLVRLLLTQSTDHPVDYHLRELQTLPAEILESVVMSSKLLSLVFPAVEKASAALSKALAEDPSKASSAHVVGTLFEDSIRSYLAQEDKVDQLFLQMTAAATDRALHIVASPREAVCALDKFYDVVFKLLSAFEEELARGVFDAAEAAEPASGSAPSTPVKPRSQQTGPVALTPSKRVGDTPAEASLGVCGRLEEHAFRIRRDLESTLDIKNSSAGIQKELNDRDALLVQKSKAIEDLEWKVKKTEHRVTQLEREMEEQKTKSDADKQKSLSREQAKEEQLAAASRQLESTTAALQSLQAQLSKLEVENQVIQHTVGAKQEHQASAASSEHVSALKEAIAYLNSENSRLRSEYGKQRLLRELPPLVSVKPAASLLSLPIEKRRALFAGLEESIARTKAISDTLAAGTPKAAARKLSTALSAIVSTVALPKIVNLADPTTSGVDQLKVVSLEHRKFRQALGKLQTDAAEVLVSGQHISREALVKHLKEAKEAAKQQENAEAPFARVRLPATSEGTLAHLPISKVDFEQLHAALIQIEPIH